MELTYLRFVYVFTNVKGAEVANNDKQFSR